MIFFALVKLSSSELDAMTLLYPVCKRSNMLQHWTHRPCIRGSRIIHQPIRIILPFLGHQKNDENMSIVKHVCQQGRLNKRKGSPLATSGSGFQVSEGALVLKALLRCCLKRKNKLVRIFKVLPRTCCPDSKWSPNVLSLPDSLTA